MVMIPMTIIPIPMSFCCVRLAFLAAINPRIEQMNPVVVNGKAVRIKMDPAILARVSESNPDKLKNNPITKGAKYQFRAILYCLSILQLVLQVLNQLTFFQPLFFVKSFNG